jgi:hypothetical protein
VWFVQAEEQFTLVSISSKKTIFFYVISQLDHRYAAEVEDIITSPPEQDPYTTLKTKLVRRLSPSREQHIRKLFTLEEMGDRKPSQFLRYLRRLLLQHLVQPATLQCTGHCHQPARGRLGRRRPHHKGRTPAGARKRCATP